MFAEAVHTSVIETRLSISIALVVQNVFDFTEG